MSKSIAGTPEPRTRSSVSKKTRVPRPRSRIVDFSVARSAIAIVITAGYLLICIQRVFFGEISEEHDHHVGDVTALDKVAITVLSATIVAVGAFPFLMAPMVSSGVNAVLRLLGGA